MLVTLTNLNKDLTVHFSDDTDMERLYGYRAILAPCYPTFVQTYLTFKAYNWQGFFGNNKITPSATKGVNSDGETFDANNFEAKTISFEFDNVFEKGSEVISPNNYLNTLLLEKNDTLHVTVQTDELFENDFYVTENTNTETGVMSPSFVKPLIKFGGSKELGQWSNFKYENETNGDLFTYDNSVNKDEFIIIDCNNLTVKNQDGIDRITSINFVDYPKIENGNNKIKWSVNSGTDYIQGDDYLPSDMVLDIKVTKLLAGVE